MNDAVPVIDCAPIDVRRIPPVQSPFVFVPVVPAAPALPRPLASPAPSIALSLHVRLSNGAEPDLSAATIDELSTVVQMFGRMPCSGSTTI